MRRRIAPTPANAMTLAGYYAVEAIKRDLRRAGIKLGEIEHGQMRRQAHDYLSGHPELVERARVVLTKADPE